MNAFVLHDGTDQAEIRRWGTCAAAIVTAHALLIALGMNWYTQRPPPGVRFPAIMVDMAPVIVFAAADADGSGAGAGDAAGRRLAAAEAAKPEDVCGTARADPAAGEAGGRGAAGAEDRTAPPKPEPARSFRSKSRCR